jgi:hypothetical protein
MPYVTRNPDRFPVSDLDTDEQPDEEQPDEEVDEEEENTGTDGPLEETAVTDADSWRRPTSAPRAARRRQNGTRGEELGEDDPMTAEPPLSSSPIGLNPTNRSARRRELSRRLRDYVTGEEFDGVNAIAITGSMGYSTCQLEFARRTNYRAPTSTNN